MKQKAFCAPIINRIKAFIVDLFIISIPLLYVTTYVILDGKNDFQHNQTAIFGVWAVFGLIQAAFFARGAQSPGYRSQSIYVVGADGMVDDFKMRIENTKLSTVKAFQSIGYDTIAAGDSFNDLGMIQASQHGFLFRSTEQIKHDYPQYPAFEEYDQLLSAIKEVVL